MAVSYIVTKSGQGYVVLCLAADVKPTSTAPASLIETDTGILYYPNGGGGWTAVSSGSGTVTTTGSPSSGKLASFSGATSITNTDLTGAVTTSGGVATTLHAVLADLGATTADFSMNTHKLTSVTDPTGAQDAATKSYVDSHVSGGYAGPYGLITPPVFGDFTWANQGGSTAGVSNGTLWMKITGGGSDNFRLLYKASAGTANTVIIALAPGSMVQDASHAFSSGIHLYDTGSGKIIGFYVTIRTGSTPHFQLLIDAYTNITTFSANYLTANYEWGGSPLIWLKIVDDGTTNRTYHFSFDGINYIQVLTQARTTFFTTPSSVAFGMNMWIGTIARVANCYSFVTSTP